MRKLTLVVAAIALIPMTAYAGGGGHLSTCSGFTEGETIPMLDSCFEGVTHFAPSDSELLIVNDGQLPHTYTAVDGSFDTGVLAPGESFALKVDDPGVFKVFCTLHGTTQGSGMAGVLLVGDATPPAVASTALLRNVKEAVAEETAPVTSVLDRFQSSVAAMPTQVNDLTKAQADLTSAIEQQLMASDPAPQPVLRLESDNWSGVLAGIAIGLALAALLLAKKPLSARNAKQSLVPSTET